LKNLLRISSVAEATTGFAAIIIPSIVIQLLFGVEVSGVALTISRLAGIALLSLGIACWPGEHFMQAFRAMSLYNLLVAIFFIYIGLSSSFVGILLWPAGILHLALAVLLIGGLFKSNKE
jgi:hypothetical protein